MDPIAERIKSAREDQGRTLRELAIATKIREPYIEAIENGRYDVLPAVYVKSFIRTVALSLGISSVEINALMDDVFDSHNESSDRLRATNAASPASSHISPLKEVTKLTTTAVNASVDGLKTIAGGANSFISRRLLIVIGIAVLLVAGVGLWKLLSGDETLSTNTTDPNSIPELNVSDAISGNSIEADSIILTARVIDTVWLTITMDGKTTNQSVFMPGDKPRWSAKDNFQISLSNAGGVEFSRNGSALPMFGRPGEAVRLIQITQKEAITSAHAFKSPTMPTSVAAPATTSTSTSRAPNPTAAPRTSAAPRTTTAPRTSAAPQSKPVVIKKVAEPKRVQQQTYRRAQQRAKAPPVNRSTRRNSIPIITPAPKQSVPVVPNRDPR